MKLSDTLRRCLDIKKGEKLLLVTDTDMLDVAEVIENSLKRFENNLIKITMNPGVVHGEEPPSNVSSQMASSDVVICATSKSLTHTLATKKAANNGARIASMPGITVEMLQSGGMTADYEKVSKSATKIADILTRGNSIEMLSKVGTRFKADISGKKGFADTGLIVERGEYGNLPGGESFIAPNEDTPEGRIVFDGPILDTGLNNSLVIVEVMKGKAVSSNHSPLSKIFGDIDKANIVAEVGIGVNPKAKLMGNILEDEKVLGTGHVAFGNNKNFGGSNDAKVHIDGILHGPTIKVDDRIILKEGLIII